MAIDAATKPRIAYLRPLTELVVGYIRAEGIAVVDSIALSVADNVAVGRRDPLHLFGDVRQLNIKGADAVVLSACVQMPSLEAVAQVEDELGLPVTSAAICTTRRMLERARPGFIGAWRALLPVGEESRCQYARPNDGGAGSVRR